jgi:hypothetical protein
LTSCRDGLDRTRAEEPGCSARPFASRRRLRNHPRGLTRTAARTGRRWRISNAPAPSAQCGASGSEARETQRPPGTGGAPGRGGERHVAVAGAMKHVAPGQGDEMVAAMERYGQLHHVPLRDVINKRPRRNRSHALHWLLVTRKVSVAPPCESHRVRVGRSSASRAAVCVLARAFLLLLQTPLLSCC